MANKGWQGNYVGDQAYFFVFTFIESPVHFSQLAYTDAWIFAKTPGSTDGAEGTSHICWCVISLFPVT